MKGNIDIFDFELTDEEMKAMQALDTNKSSPKSFEEEKQLEKEKTE